MTRYAACRLPDHRGPAAWNAILEPQQPPQVFEGNQTFDAAIIGGGFAGLSAARRLHQLDPNLKVAVLEAGRLAEGAAGRNSGFMIDLPHDLASDNYGGGQDADKATIALNRMAQDFALKAAEEFQIPEEMISPTGKINAAATEAGDRHNVEFQTHLETMGETSTLMSQQEMLEHTGSPHYTSGLFTPGTIMLQPAGYIRALGAGISKVVDVFENSPVRAFEKQSTGWRLKVGGGTLSAGQIILANNGHVESFGFYPRQLMHIFLYASMSKPLTAEQKARLRGAARWGVTPSDPMGTSVRRVSGTYGDRILIRTGASFRPSMTVSAGMVARSGRTHDRKFSERFPMLPDLEMEYRWAGHLCLSRNGVSAFGELDDGVFSACCQNGLGTAKGTLAGMAAAELALGETSVIAEALLAQDPPEKLPPEPLSFVGANAYLKWKEFRSGKE